MSDGSVTCARDVDCADESFCNGVERCRPTAAGADARGCVAGVAPCMAGQTCDETAGQCHTMCAVTADADGDGATARECGGLDCDDADAQRFPGNPEVCDPDRRDEDCDRFTVGERDADRDGFIDLTCCNHTAGAEDVCGQDCDDATASIHPGAAEVCNDRDDDCDAATDEGVARTFWPDTDHDGWGDASAGSDALVRACVPRTGFVENALDCNDASPLTAPGRPDVCNGENDDCDASTDESDTSLPDCAARYGTPPHTDWLCTSGACAVSCPTGFDDCDHDPSNGCEADLSADAANCGACRTYCGVGGECLSGTCDEVVDVEVGETFSCARRAPSGRVVCWGDNRYGQLGRGTIGAAGAPEVVMGVEGIVQLGLSQLQDRRAPVVDNPLPFACARTDSSVVCWGGETHGQLGDGTLRGFADVPGSVAGVPRFDPFGAAVIDGLAVGAYHACVSQVPAVSGTEQHGVDCWGLNDFGQVATGGPAETAIPVVGLPYNVGRGGFQLAAGRDLSCAAFPSTMGGIGRLTCWGSIVGSFTPTVYDEIDAGGSYVCGRAGGRVACMGAQPNGELGLGDTTTRTTPTFVPGVTDATRLAIGPTTACIVHGDGTLTCAGAWWAFGDLTSSPHPNQVAIATPPDVVDVSIAYDHACLVDAHGDVYCWGNNDWRQVDPTSLGGLFTTPTLVGGL